MSALTDPSLAGPCIFWFWNASPTRQQIDAQVAEIAAGGFEGIYVHPIPQSFRPAEFNGGMEIEYLSPAYFDLIQHACGAIKRHGLTMWLYDEGGWPSGRANGRVVGENPDFGIWVLEDRDGRVQAVQMTDGCTYPDLMNPAATACFIRLTHDRYRQAIGNEFGRTVRGIFTDEARLLGRVGTPQVPWTPGFADAFADQHGYALEPVLGHLIHPAAAGSAEWKTQRDYLTTMGRLIAENYYKPIRDWCQKHGLLFEGHHSGEDEFGRHGQYFGDYLQQARHYHIPGVDTIWRQIHPGQAGGNYVLLAPSSAWKRGGRIAVSESFAVYGPGLTLEQMKWIVSFQAVRGIAKIGAMAYHLSSEGARWLGVCHDLSGRTPNWSHVDLLTGFMHNVAEFICRGDPVVNVGVYYRSELTPKGQETAFTRQHERLCDQLGDQLLGWAFLGLDDLREGKVQDGKLRCGQIGVEMIVVHIDGPMLAEETRVFDHLCRSGLRVIAIAANFEQSLPARAEKIGSIDQLNLRGLRTVEVDRELTGVRLLQLQNKEWLGYLIFNQNATPIEFDLRPRTAGQMVPVELESKASGLPGDGSRSAASLIRLRAGELRAFEVGTADGVKCVGWGEPIAATSIETGWNVVPIESFTIQNGITRSPVQANPRSCALGDLRETMPDFSGKIAYTNKLFIESSEPGTRWLLDLGIVCHTADVLLNGELLGRRAWAPYTFDLTAKLITGENRLEVHVTGTLASAWLSAVRQMDPAWRNMYVDKVEPWAAESTSLGIVGPVVLRKHAPGGIDE